MTTATEIAPRLRVKYDEEIIPALKETLGIDNVHALPRIDKISVNMGVGKATENKKLLDAAVRDLATITGQQPVVTKSRKSIAQFKLRQGMPIGCRVTLRGARMYEFLDRLINVVMPRIRDFRGISPKAFDHAGNYNLGLQDQLVFPEINLDKVEHQQGMDIAITIRNGSREGSFEMLRLLGMPFRKDTSKKKK